MDSQNTQTTLQKVRNLPPSSPEVQARELAGLETESFSTPQLNFLLQ